MGLQQGLKSVENRYNFMAIIASNFWPSELAKWVEILYFSESLVFMQGPADIKFSKILQLDFPIFKPEVVMVCHIDNQISTAGNFCPIFAVFCCWTKI